MEGKSLSSDRVWLNESERIASFHSIGGYELRSFMTHEAFIEFMYSLMESGYRFQ